VHNLTSIQKTTPSMYSADEEVPVIQTVSFCLTSTHGECSGYYQDQSGSVLVRCVCKCHEVGAAT
jgi:hypothetical protein